jgi:hypothetical protein
MSCVRRRRSCPSKVLQPAAAVDLLVATHGLTTPERGTPRAVRVGIVAARRGVAGGAIGAELRDLGLDWPRVRPRALNEVVLGATGWRGVVLARGPGAKVLEVWMRADEGSAT